MSIPESYYEALDLLNKIDREKESVETQYELTTVNKDLKSALGGKKPLFGLLSPAPMNHWARAMQWGNFKYLESGDYLRIPQGLSNIEVAIEYLSAAGRHIQDMCDSLIRYRAGGINAVKTLEEAVYCADEESYLPQIDHALASLGIVTQKLVDLGLLPEDPGTPWLNYYAPTKEPGKLILKND